MGGTVRSPRVGRRSAGNHPRVSVAIVTGSDSGIGRAAAVALAARGLDVGLAWHEDEAGARATAEEVSAHGRRAAARRLDLTRLPQAGDVVDELTDALGGLDVLVNNAGTGHSTPFLAGARRLATSHCRRPRGAVRVRAARGAAHGRRWASGPHRQRHLGARARAAARRSGLLRRQGRPRSAHQGDVARARRARHRGQRRRAGRDRHADDGRRGCGSGERGAAGDTPGATRATRARSRRRSRTSPRRSRAM